ALKTWARTYWTCRLDDPGVASPGVTLPFVQPTGQSQRDVLVVGNLAPHKCVDESIRAFSLSVRSGAEARKLRIVGGEGHPGIRVRLATVAEREGVADRVEFMGFLTGQDLVRAYAESACYLSTSALEAFPLPPLEAMAAGRPVVVPDTASFREVCGP